MPDERIDCPDCDRTFKTVQGLKSHQRHTHGDDDGGARTPTRLRALLDRGDFSRGDGYSILVGAIVGAILAHVPALAGTGSVGVVTGGAVYRFATRALRRTPEGNVIQYLDTFFIGVIVLFAVVWATHNGHLDFLFHLIGGHAHG